MQARVLLGWASIALWMVVVGAPPAVAQEEATPLARAVELIRSRQYNDAIKILTQDIKGKKDEQIGQQLLMLGECYYLTKNYNEARPILSRANKQLPEGKEKTIAEYRLACTHYRMQDLAGAEEKIDAFVAKYPGDARSGTLLLFKMLIHSGKGAGAEKQITEIYEKLKGFRRGDQTVGMEADQILSDFYRRIGQEEKAQAVYVSIVNNFRSVIADLQQKRQPVPPSFEKSHDNAAFQLGLMALEKRQMSDAARWLDNVRYDQEYKARARLLLARIAYERRDFKGAMQQIAGDGFLDTVPAGQVKSDMYLMLGLCEKDREGGNPSVVEEHLRKVGADAKGYAQAQSVLGDLYFEKRLIDDAEKCYQKAMKSGASAAHALRRLAEIAVQRAEDDPKLASAQYKQAAGYLNELLVKHPLTGDAKDAKPLIEVLAGKGIAVGTITKPEDLVAGWEKTVKDGRGSFEAAQALASIMRHHFKAVLNEKKQMTKAPDYVACAAACDRLLEEKTYSGKGFESDQWRGLRGEALYHRATCELASVKPPTGKPGEAKPNYLPKATVERALPWFEQAKSLLDRKQADLQRATELGLLEAMFKSEKADLRDQAEKRINELESELGADPRFQRLMIDLADWYAGQKRYADAARQYAGVADRGKDLTEDERQRLLFSAGTLYSRAASELQQKADNSSYAVYVFPKPAIDLGGDGLKAFPALQRRYNFEWPNEGKDVPAVDALVTISKYTQVPFVWSPATGAGTIAGHLAEKKLTLQNGAATAGEALWQVLDKEKHKLTPDIGLTGGEPTLKPGDRDDPEAAGTSAIEIYDVRQEPSRLKPLGEKYGRFDQVHRPAAMAVEILERIERKTGVRILLAEGVDRQEKLGKEYSAPPGYKPSDGLTYAEVLTAVLGDNDLRWRITRRDRSSDYYDKAFACYDRVQKIRPKSEFGEKAIFRVALDYYNQREYGKMKAMLRGYLKIFDSPGNQYYHQACFWIGWSLENERKLRDACNYYSRAAEERLVICRPEEGESPRSHEALLRQFSVDTQHALLEEVVGEFKEMTLSQFARWIQLSARIDARLDGSVASLETKLDHPAFKKRRAFDVLCETLEPLGLSFKVENVEGETAERAYYRLAVVQRRDNQMDAALEYCKILMERYPKSDRVREVQKLLVDIYRGLKDYGKVLTTLEELRRTAKDPAEKRQLDNEVAAMYFDLADYTKAAEAFRSSLTQTKDGAEKQKLHAAYARCLFRLGDVDAALAEYKELAKQPTGPLSAMLNNLMVFYLRFHKGELLEREFPREYHLMAINYEKLTDAQRDKLSQTDLVRISWIYYILGLCDAKQGRAKEAMEKFRAATRSPDDMLAGDAGIRLATLQRTQKESDQARRTLEYLLISVRATESSESVVRATYMLALCHEDLGQKDRAAERLREVVERYPQSPYAELAKKHALYRAQAPSTGEKT